jgi:hypothetical protein
MLAIGRRPKSIVSFQKIGDRHPGGTISEIQIVHLFLVFACALEVLDSIDLA